METNKISLKFDEETGHYYISGKDNLIKSRKEILSKLGHKLSAIFATTDK